MEEIEALSRDCPFRIRLEGEGARCIGHKCMAWRASGAGAGEGDCELIVRTVPAAMPPALMQALTMAAMGAMPPALLQAIIKTPPG